MSEKIEYIRIDASGMVQLQRMLKESGESSLQELKKSLQRLAEGENAGVLLTGEVDAMQRADAPGGILSAGSLRIDGRTRLVRMDGREVSLTPKEFDILYFLAEHRGEVFTKEQIYLAVWGETYQLDDSNIMAFIRKLRKKIEPNPDAPEYILTVWGIGYKFNDRL